MKTKTVFVIRYNDCFGNGNNEEIETDSSIEGVIENQEDFPKWLEEHNKNRIDAGDEPELEEEFDIISTTMYTF